MRGDLVRALSIGAIMVTGLAAAGWPRPGAALTQAGAAAGGAVTFVVDKVRDNKGVVRVDICTADTFLKDNCPYSGFAPAVKGETTVTVPAVPPGTYAAQLYHDRNGDGQLNRGALGIPLEEFGFSQNAPHGLRGPKFSVAAFDHGTDDQTLKVKLQRY